MGRITAVTAVLLLALLPACGPQEASAQLRISQAPAATQEERSALMSMEMAMTGGQQDVTVTAEGGVDFANHRSTMTIHMGEEMAETGFTEMRLITDGTTLYLQMPNAEQLGLPTAWMKMDLEAMSGMQGMGELQQMGNDPTKSMEMLQGVSDDVTEVGSEDIRGEPTTHYQATIDMDKALEQMPEDARPYAQQQMDMLGTSTLPVEVWIDEAGRLRRQRIEMDLSQMAESSPGAPTRVVTTVEMFDFGADVDVEPPPADEVTDFADLQGMGG
jgi:hypothetical protein